MAGGNAEECRAAFAMFDADSSGTIDVGELCALSAQLGHEMSAHDAQAVMQEIDTDCSGEIDVEEFTSWWRSRDTKIHGSGGGAGGGVATAERSGLLAGLRKRVKGAVETAERIVMFSSGKLKLQVPSGVGGGRSGVTIAKWEFKQVEVRLRCAGGRGGGGGAEGGRGPTTSASATAAQFELRGCGGKHDGQSFVLQMKRQIGKQAQAVDERDSLYYRWRVLSGLEQFD